MNLKDQIETELITALKAGDALRKETLRMLKAEILREAVAGAQRHEVNDAEIVKIVKKMIKQRVDAAEQFTNGGRTESAEKEQAEIEILEKYLPAQISEEKLVEIITAKKAELGITDKTKMGPLIGAVLREVGDAADGGKVKELVAKSFE